VMLGRQTAKERVASFLIQLAERTSVEDGETLALPMSRQDIADYLGLTIETVCRTLSEFKRGKLIGISDLHQAELKDLEALHTIAEGDEGI
jgi:CRP/FNR family transcriptional regulator, anaerobic regulatory protein